MTDSHFPDYVFVVALSFRIGTALSKEDATSLDHNSAILIVSRLRDCDNDGANSQVAPKAVENHPRDSGLDDLRSRFDEHR